MRSRVELHNELAAMPARGPASSTLRLLQRRLERAARILNIPAWEPAPVSVSLVGLHRMAALHLEWMQLPGPTDVLSMPAAAMPGCYSVGDIVLCWPWITEQANRGQAQSSLHEATILGVHGLVHLCGHDHRNPRQSRRMHQLERKVLRSLAVPDLPRPYVRASLV